jgi:hypothetical protein
MVTNAAGSSPTVYRARRMADTLERMEEAATQLAKR